MLIVFMAVFLQLAVSKPHTITSHNFHQLFATPLSQFHSSAHLDSREWMVMFHTPWCGHCKNAKPIFQAFSNVLIDSLIKEAEEVGMEIEEAIRNGVQVGTVDCMTEDQICQYFNIRGFPTFYYLTAEKKAVSYEGPRTIDGFFGFYNAHDLSKGDQYCEEGFVNHGWLELFQQAFQIYWREILGFGLVLPLIIGYFLAKCLLKRDRNKMKAQRLKILKQKEEQRLKMSGEEETGQTRQKQDENHSKND